MRDDARAQTVTDDGFALPAAAAMPEAPAPAAAAMQLVIMSFCVSRNYNASRVRGGIASPGPPRHCRPSVFSSVYPAAASGSFSVVH